MNKIQQTLHLVRGMPGSGKSTYAKLLASSLNVQHFEADMYFMKDGEYLFDVKKISHAHGWCQCKVFDALHDHYSVVVSNTFTTPSEMVPYVIEAEFQNVKMIRIIQMCGQWESVHNVPQQTLEKMKNRFVDNTKLKFHEEFPNIEFEYLHV